MKREKAFFGATKDGRQTCIYTLSNANGMCVRVSDYGAAMVSLIAPDREGKLADVILGFDDVSGYENTNTYMGATIGRHAGQICRGLFSLNGKEYRLTINDHDHTMHGGPEGFHSRLFEVAGHSENELKLTYASKDGEAGFPGNLNITVVYRLSDENALRIEYFGICDQDTICSMTNHAYFNLNGPDGKDALDNRLRISAEQYTEVDDQGLPTGAISPVGHTPFDFCEFHVIGERIGEPNRQLQFCGGYDHNWIISAADDQKIRLICEMQSRDGRRHMQMFSNQPGLQMYSGNYLDGTERGKNGIPHVRHGAVCLEPQLFPNGLENAHFPSPVLRKGEEYSFYTEYRFIP